MFNIKFNKKNSFGLILSKNLDTCIKKPKTASRGIPIKLSDESMLTCSRGHYYDPGIVI